MKKIAYIFVAALVMTACGGDNNSEENTTDTDTTNLEVNEVIEVEEETPKPPKSPRLESSGTVDGVEVSIAFGSPYVKGREIWGDLIPYDKIWRAGANDATAVTFGEAVLVDGETVDAGTYALFIIPTQDNDWTIILNEEWSKEEHGVWGAYDHKPEKDVLRFDVTPTLDNENVESLAFTVTESGLSFAWEKVAFQFSIIASK